jgi:hypothetical protein
MSGNTPEGNTAVDIRKLAVTMALLVWLWGFAEARRSHFGLGSSAILGLEAAVAGFTAWATYHLISRRNDGMAFFVCSAMAPSTHLGAGRLPSFWVLFLPQFLVCLVFGLLARLKARRDEAKKTKAAGDDPLYDAELDRTLRI